MTHLGRMDAYSRYIPEIDVLGKRDDGDAIHEEYISALGRFGAALAVTPSEPLMG